MKTKLLLTGAPGVGKTTAVCKLARLLAGWRIRGFYTEEMLLGGQRQGFRVRTFEGREGTLAHIHLRTPYRVGRYGVDVRGFEEAVEGSLAWDPEVDLYLVDEIGKMECFAPKFVLALQKLLDSKGTLVATVAQKGEGLISEVKGRKDVELWEITSENRDQVPARLAEHLKALRRRQR